jgi:GNAT superfamily N-acetyltransferase
MKSSTASPTIRAITDCDIPALFPVRVATHENRLSREELTALGITEASVKERLHGSFKGWLCEVDDRVVGFAIGDRATGELWLIAVLPEYIGRGIGSALLSRVEGWLRDSGCDRLWLTTDVDPRLKAYTFYLQHGWHDDRIDGDVRYMTKVCRGTARACTSV